MKPSHSIRPVFDDENLVSAAGLVPALRLAESAGLYDLLEDRLSLASANTTAKTTSVIGGMLAGAGVAGHFVLLFLSLALWWALGNLMGLGWSGVVVAVLWGVVAAVLAAKGRKELNAVKGLPQTAETLQEIPPTLKPTT